MNITIVGDKDRYDKFAPYDGPENFICTYISIDATEDEIIERGSEAEVLFLDAITPATARMMDAMPELKMIHSEGVAYDKVDIEAAAARNIFVCNNKGMNASAVAEQAVLLMLELLRDSVAADEAVRAGKQITFKQNHMNAGVHELGGMAVGLVGFGDIAMATAKLLNAFGSRVFYWNRTRKAYDAEASCGAKWLPLNQLCKTCDFISLHLAATAETDKIVNSRFLSNMKSTAYLVNTARGDLVDNEALRDALINNVIAGAAFDTLNPEPTTADHPLVALPKDCSARLVYSSHLGGVTIEFFERAHRHMWKNAERIAKGELPDCVVNRK